MLPLLSLCLPPTQAMPLMVVPALASNSWQAKDSGISWPDVRRFRPILATLPLRTLATVPFTPSRTDATPRCMEPAAVLLAVACRCGANGYGPGGRQKAPSAAGDRRP